MHVGRFVGTLALSVNHRRGVSCGPMVALLASFFMILLGLALAGSVNLALGVVVFVAGALLFEHVSERAEEAFFTLLTLAAVVGVALEVKSYFFG
jgi:uncharacterized membrane protein YoaK (UPF0700 family)